SLVSAPSPRPSVSGGLAQGHRMRGHEASVHVGFPEFTRFFTHRFPGEAAETPQPIALPTELPGNAALIAKGGPGRNPRGAGAHISGRPSSARPTVMTSAYSMSPPTGIPCAMRVTRTPRGFSSFAR